MDRYVIVFTVVTVLYIPPSFTTVRRWISSLSNRVAKLVTSVVIWYTLV